jgi:polar amino acid transport system substrate-binding protein
MRTAVVAAVLALAVLATTTVSSARDLHGARTAKVCANAPTVSTAGITIGAASAALEPWFGDGDPSTRKGFESAVAYAVAKQLGYAPSKVRWVQVPGGRLFDPAQKLFDLAIGQIPISAARAKAVSFSDAYYTVNQAVVVARGKPITHATTLLALREYTLGAQLGTPSHDYLEQRIRPATAPVGFPRSAAAIQALTQGKVDGVVVDLPAAFAIAAAEDDNAVVLGQFPAASGGARFGMVLAKGSPLVACVNRAIAALKGNGTLSRLQQQWLAVVPGAPVLN